MVSVCLPSNVLLQHLPSYLGLSYLCVGYLFTAAPVKHSHCSLVHQSQLPALSVLVVAERSYPTSEARGSGWEEQVQGAVAAGVQEGLEELSHVKVRKGGGEEIPLVQVQSLSHVQLFETP